MVQVDDIEGAVRGPSDRELVELLQRMAAARAHLLQAEEAAEGAGDVIPARNDAIEEARADVLWAQAQLCTSKRTSRAERDVAAAVAKEKTVLRRFGYSSFKDYLRDRTSTPTADVHLQVARAEYQAAQTDWERAQADMLAARVPTAVVDLTGDAPRSIL
ncbi:MAG: hypothetical protein R2699_08875 [Acidimicrobiales bacterium]|nr:hypothetical protein [Acidimicrobiales bacterium]